MAIIPKITVDVEITFYEGTTQLGQVYINANQRVLDMLNEPTGFFPFRVAGTGQITLLNKSSVVAIRPLDQRG